MIVARENDLRPVQEFFLRKPASEYQLLGYNTTSLIPGKIQNYTAVARQD
jgi:hypothetical protein